MNLSLTLSHKTLINLIGLTFKTQQVYVIQPNEGSGGINHWVAMQYEEIATWTKDLAFKNSTFFLVRKAIYQRRILKNKFICTNSSTLTATPHVQSIITSPQSTARAP